MVARLIYVRLIAMFGRVPLMVASMVLASVAFASLAIPMPIAALYAATSTTGFCIGIATTITITSVVVLTAAAARGTANSLRVTGKPHRPGGDAVRGEASSRRSPARGAFSSSSPSACWLQRGGLLEPAAEIGRPPRALKGISRGCPKRAPERPQDCPRSRPAIKNAHPRPGPITKWAQQLGPLQRQGRAQAGFGMRAAAGERVMCRASTILVLASLTFASSPSVARWALRLRRRRCAPGELANHRRRAALGSTSTAPSAISPMCQCGTRAEPARRS